MREAALVLGASGGIGGACVHRLARRYETVLTVSRRPPAQDVLDAGDVRWVSADVSMAEGRTATCELVRESAAPLGAVVVASGVAHRGPLVDQREDEWWQVLGANVVGPAQLISALVREATWVAPAGIVLIGSLSARRGLPDRALYGASKAALEHFGRCIAVELADRGISVNTISAGVTETPFLAGDEERLARYARERIPAGRLVQPEEVAEAVAYALTSTGALTGATIDLDGGTGVLG